MSCALGSALDVVPVCLLVCGLLAGRPSALPSLTPPTPAPLPGTAAPAAGILVILSVGLPILLMLPCIPPNAIPLPVAVVLFPLGLAVPAALFSTASCHTHPTPPKGKCCTTTRLPKHSAAYILSIPACTFTQFGTVVAISHSKGECSWNGPRLST